MTHHHFCYILSSLSPALVQRVGKDYTGCKHQEVGDTWEVSLAAGSYMVFLFQK